MTAHTPGPWTHASLMDGAGGIFAFEQRICEMVYKNHKANARLIAAAPDLLRAIRVALIEMQSWDCDEEDTATPVIELLQAA